MWCRRASCAPSGNLPKRKSWLPSLPFNKGRVPIIVPLEYSDLQLLASNSRPSSSLPRKWVVSLAPRKKNLTGQCFGSRLDRTDLDFEKQTITVRRSSWYGRFQTPKSRAAVRTVPMPEVLAKGLKNHARVRRPNRASLLFATRTGTPYSANTIVQRKLWPILDALKIPRCGFHGFRHSASTLLIDLGASPKTVQSQLGPA